MKNTYILQLITRFWCYLFLTLSIVGAFLIFAANYNNPWQHFSDQAQSFLQGRLDVNPNPWDKHDYVYREGKYYWPEGPFPSILLAPFTAIAGPKIFHQGTMQLVLILISIFTLYKLSRFKNFNFEDSIFLVCVFLLGSTSIWMILDAKSWFFAQVVAISFLLLLVFELETKRRYLILGILEGALLATRPTAGFIAFAIIPIIFLEKASTERKLTNLASFAVFPTLSVIALLFFNFLRFGNFLDNGYTSNDIGGFQEPLRKMGLFSVKHIPTNFYYYFLQSYQPVTKISAHLGFPFIKFDAWGLSFFLVAPFFMTAFKVIGKYWFYWAVIGITLFTTLSYYSPGWFQLGPRYTADFMPILFVLLLNALNGKLTPNQKLLISVSCFLNVYLLYTRQFGLIPA